MDSVAVGVRVADRDRLYPGIAVDGALYQAAVKSFWIAVGGGAFGEQYNVVFR